MTALKSLRGRTGVVCDTNHFWPYRTNVWKENCYGHIFQATRMIVKIFFWPDRSKSNVWCVFGDDYKYNEGKILVLAMVQSVVSLQVEVGGVEVMLLWEQKSPLHCTAHCSKAPINLPVKLNKDDDFYEIVTFFPKFSIMTSYLGIVISVFWIFCAN